MSIWASSFTTRAEWSDEPVPPRPLDYIGSHVMPDAESPRGGHIDCAELPCFVRHNRDHPNAGYDPDGIEPFLRFEIDGYEAGARVEATQILDADTVRGLRDYLTDWLDRIDDTAVMETDERGHHPRWLRAHADLLDNLPALITGGPGDGAIADQMRMAADEMDRLQAAADGWENDVGRALYGGDWPGDLASGRSDLTPLIRPLEIDQ